MEVKMKTSHHLIRKIIVLLIIIAFPCASLAFFTNDLKRGEDRLQEARTLLDRGQADAANAKIDEAIGYFQTVLAESKTGGADVARAQENLGYCYWHKGNELHAQHNFKLAAQDGSAQIRIVSFLKGQGQKAEKENDLSRVFAINRYTVSINPEIRQEPIAIYTEAARQHLIKGESNIARSYLNEVIWMDSGQRETAARLFYEAGNQVSEPTRKIKIYRQALEYDPGYQDRIVESLATLASTQDKRTYDSLLRQNFPSHVYAMIHEQAWPWREVYRQTFTGVGYTGGDFTSHNQGGIKTIRSGNDIQIGDRFTVINSDFELWINGRWQHYRKGEWIYVEKMNPGKFQAIRKKEGELFTVIVQRK